MAKRKAKGAANFVATSTKLKSAQREQLTVSSHEIQQGSLTDDAYQKAREKQQKCFNTKFLSFLKSVSKHNYDLSKVDLSKVNMEGAGLQGFSDAMQGGHDDAVRMTKKSNVKGKWLVIRDILQEGFKNGNWWGDGTASHSIG
jgi:magnesium-transporting ATPase (P-type)